MRARKSTVDIDGGILRLQFPYHPNYVCNVRLLDGAKWDPLAKEWRIPYSKDALDRIKKIFVGVEMGAGLAGLGGDSAENTAAKAEKRYLCRAQNARVAGFTFATEPFWHQKVSFNFTRALPQAGLFLEMGLGKAKIAIDLATWRYREGQLKRVLIVCPNSVLSQWAVEINKHGGADFKKHETLKGGCRDKIAQCRGIITDRFAGFVLVNYDALLNMYADLADIQGSDARLFDMLVLDESSMIKHATSKRSKICWKLGRTVMYRNILTGTPITQSLEDIFSQYRFLRPEVFGVFSTAFRAQYLIMGGFENREIVGYRNIDGALKKIYQYAIRFTKDRCLDLPPKVYEFRSARMDDDTSRKYRQLEKECVAEFDGGMVTAPLMLTRLMKLSQLTGGFIYEAGSDGKRIATHRMPRIPKIEALEEVLDEDPGRKVIIWCRFTEELLLIRKALDRRGVRHVSIAGDISGPERGAAVKQFQEDPGTLAFVGQESTAGLGITLTAASLVIYYSNDYSLEHRLQTEDRCHRIGQTKSVTYIDILAETSGGGKTIDHDTLAVLRGKSRFAGEISRALMQKMTMRQAPPSEKVAVTKALARAQVGDDPDIISEQEVF